MKYYRGVGRRKTSTATVRLFEEKGPLLVNGKPIEEYFPGEIKRKAYMEPFSVTDTEGKFRGTIKVEGGGKNGQLGAVVLGIARALVNYDSELKPALAEHDLLTRDPRMKERKKPFLKKARKAPQYSKR